MSEVFTPSLARRGLDELLTRYPHLDLLWIERGADEILTPRGVTKEWTIVTLGQPSQGKTEAWARFMFAVWNRTGAVYRMAGPGGPVEDDPYITVATDE